jgi:hypothetical protein
MNLTRKSWNLGWLPVNDAHNGNPEGLLRADNLELDELGVLSLANSSLKLNSSSLSGEVIQLYSKTIGNTKYRYAVLSNGTIVRSNDNFTSQTELVTGEAITRVGFASVLGQNLICAGSTRLKDDGTTIRQLGLRKPDLPPTKADSVVSEVLIGPNFADWVAEWGTIQWDDLSPYGVNNFSVIGIYPAIAEDGVTYWGIAAHTHDYNLDVIGGNPGTNDDTFTLWFSATNLNSTLKIEFLLNDPLYPSTDTYTYEITDPPGSLFSTTGGGATLTIKRSEFQRNGTNPNLGWANVHCVKIMGMTPGLGIYFLGFKLTSQFLIGKSYNYATMNVANLGTYIAKSPLSDKSLIIEAVGGQIRIKADSPVAGTDTDTQINEIWIFRRSSEITDVTPINNAPILDKWYRVGVLNYPADGLELQDTYTDEDALTLNITADESLISVKDIKDEIIGIVAGYYDRVLYLTAKELYISEILNPDSVAVLNTIKLEGGNITQNLWIVKSSLGVVFVGTTQDIFELSGTFASLPDGSIDVSVKSLAVAYPPLSYEVEVFSTVVYYMAKDGFRDIAPGGASELLTMGTLDLLFQGESRHGIPPVQLIPKGVEHYPIAITQSHLFISVPHTDGTRRVLDYNTSTKVWNLRTDNPLSFFVEDDGMILAGYGGGDNYVRQFNYGKKKDGITGQEVKFLTAFDDNQQPRNRKDVFTLKITGNTGNVAIGIWIGTDEDGFTYLGTQAFNGVSEHLFTLGDVVNKRMAYALRIEGTGLSTFQLHNYTIEYEAYPEQLTYLRIPNNNLGSYSRKRITNYAFVIDTLGNTITFTPIVDGTNLSSTNVIFSGKRTFIHYFKIETLGTDIGGLLSGGTFEFYGLNLEEIVSEKLPTPVKFLVIPNTDYGEPNRKRHSSYKFQINTNGENVKFTPRLDGVDQTSIVYNTNEKLTVEYFFSEDTIAIDIGGTLESLADTEFEFYGVIKPQQIEVLPPRLKEFRIPENNYGIAARKRIRTMPMEINTNGYNVTFTPIIDGVSGIPSILNSSTRKTLFHYFSTDIFGTDFSGELIGSEPFEFYGLLKPESVEVLPVAKKLDQIGPLRFDKIGKLFCCRTRLIAQANETIQIKFYDEDAMTLGTPIYTKNLAVTMDKDEVYEFAFPKSVKTSVLRIVIGPSTSPIHRYDMQLKTNFAGMDSDPKWIKVK